MTSLFTSHKDIVRDEQYYRCSTKLFFPIFLVELKRAASRLVVGSINEDEAREREREGTCLLFANWWR